MKPHRRHLWMAMVAVVVMLAGILFGYDQGVISGALAPLSDTFKLSSTISEVVTSWVTLGALVGALAAGLLADRMGRKRALLLAAVLFMGGAALEGFAPDAAVLIVARFIVGFGVGVASVAAPLYAAETARADRRGRLVSAYQLAITVGILIAYLIDDILAQAGSWRLMLGISAVPGAALALVMLVMPESPRWLMKMSRRHDAEHSMGKLHPDGDTAAALDAVQADLDDEGRPASWREVFGPTMRKALFVGVGLSVFQQITGINAVIYYADRIFANAGFSTPEQQSQATLWAVGVVNVVATLIAIAVIDRFGRKPLLRFGLIGMTVGLVGLALSFGFASSGSSALGILTLVLLVLFIASFAASLGPVTWTVINEIYPNRVRARAVAVATAVNWGAAFIVAQTFLSLIGAIGTAFTFGLFAVASIVAYIWVQTKVPETKNRTLEEISASLIPDAA